MENEENKVYKRPWGTYKSIKIYKTAQVKWIEVNQKSKLSLQRHFKRSEHWVVIEGNPSITLNNTKKKYSPNDHIFIPIQAVHRIENETDEKVIIVEVQMGTYLGEDDIERLEDIYNRT